MGPSISKASTTVDNTLKASIAVEMNSIIDNNSTAYCMNLQSASNINNCNVNFGDQVCKALAVSNLNADASLQADLQQDIFNDISASSSAMNEGLSLQLAQVSDSSTVVKNLIDISSTVTQTLTTKCTRNATGVNQQNIDGCTSSVINFGKQDVDVQIMGDCTVNHMAESKVKQKIENLISASASSSNKGISMFDGLIMAIIALAATGVLGKIVTSKGKQQDAPGEANSRKVLLFLMFLFFVLFVGGWPLTMNYFVFHAWPFSPPEDDKSDICRGGRNIEHQDILSSMVWYDPLCLSLLFGDKPEGGACTDTAKWKHYTGCGIFATSGACDSDAFASDQERLKTVIKACTEIIPENLRACTVRDLTYEETIIPKLSYNGCTRCTNDDSIYGLFVNNGKACDPSKLSHTVYKIPDGGRCPNDGSFCKETVAELLAASPNDCTQDEYQTAKQKFSKNFRACQIINDKAAAQPKDGYVPSFADQCPPDPYEYLNCDKNSQRCFYDPKGCTGCDGFGNCQSCPGVNPDVYASCHNDFSKCCSGTNPEDGSPVCKDPKYAKDKAILDQANALCTAKSDYQKNMYYIPFIFGTIELLLLVGMAFIVSKTPSLGATIMANMEKHSNKIFTYGVIAFVGLAGVLIATALMMIVHAEKSWSVFSVEFRKTLVAYDESTFETTAYIMYGVFGLMLLFAGPYTIFLYKTRPSATEISALLGATGVKSGAVTPATPVSIPMPVRMPTPAPMPMPGVIPANPSRRSIIPQRLV